MAYFLAVFSFSQYTTPAALSQAELTGDTYATSDWIGGTFTYNGGGSTLIEVTDDDDDFEDAYVETGTAQTLTQDVTIDGTTYDAGSTVENEFAMVDSSGRAVYIVRINGENVGFTYAKGDEPVTDETFTVDAFQDGAAEDSSEGQGASTTPYDTFVCFAKGTLIATPDGPRRVEQIAAGDLVVTADAGARPVRWAGASRVRFDRSQGRAPVLFSAGSLGCGWPRRDLIVSHQHRILLGGLAVERRFALSEVLAPARGLCGLRGVRAMRGKRALTYVHLLLDSHAILFAEGAAAESFYPGPVGLRSLGGPDRQAVLALFPDLEDDPIGGYGPPARRFLTCGEARDLARDLRQIAGTGQPGAAFGRGLAQPEMAGGGWHRRAFVSDKNALQRLVA